MRGGVWLALAGVLMVGACRHEKPIRVVAGGDPETGEHLITKFGCGSCHVVPGIKGANGMVGPPLDHFARRAFIAGEVSNETDYLIRWLEVPQAIEPGTAMPNLGVSEGQARSIAAYLYTLR